MVGLIIMLGGLYILGKRSQSGKPPGLVSGRLSSCSHKPNCVNSEYPEDQSHYIPPLRYPAFTSEESMSLIKNIIQELGGRIVVEKEMYLSATFVSGVFGFVDDLECRNDALNHTIHLRSASRVGHSDFGVNKKRVMRISKRFNKKNPKNTQGCFPEVPIWGLCLKNNEVVTPLGIDLFHQKLQRVLKVSKVFFRR